MIFEKKVVGIYRSQFLTRCDDAGLAHYFSHADFPGLQQEAFSFPSSCGHTLQGWFYHYETVIPGRIVVFDHGFGGGHGSYMKEIEMLCRHGYLVFSYDHTGCMESGGENPGGLSQSLRDLNDCLTALKKHPACADLLFSVMGHSWGGFSTLNIAALHPDITHIVVLSGFTSVERMLEQFFSGILKGYRKPILAIEQQANPDFAAYRAENSLRDTHAKTLLIYSDNDKLVVKEMHFDLLKKALAGRDNIRFLLEKGKSHNPNYTADAVVYLGEYATALAKLQKEKKLTTDAQKKAFRESWDWDRMTVQDERVWDEIFRTLDN